MDTITTLDPSQRRVLVNLGNRYVVFGPPASLPQSIPFDPDADSEVLPRVEDEGDVAETRIAQTLRVAGMTRAADVTETSNADIELIDGNGSRVFIELKVRNHDPKQRDFEQGTRLLKEAASGGKRLEVWYFNIERLNLILMHLDRSNLQIDRLSPLDVWEKTKDGVFTRARVVGEVEDWLQRVTALYCDVQAWLWDRPGLRFEQSRTVVMSEEMMQEFAVPDREVPVLDVFDGDQVVASFVPRGLWMIASWGRIDIITRDRTYALVALGGVGKLEWRLVSPEGRQRTDPFNKTVLLVLLSQQ
jgi:hypothetical protein